MSLPKKQMFYNVGLKIPIERDETGNTEGYIDYSYSYLESGRTFEKHIRLTLLGLSNELDMRQGDEEALQMLATDEAGEIYEVVIKGGDVIAIRDIRTTK